MNKNQIGFLYLIMFILAPIVIIIQFWDPFHIEGWNPLLIAGFLAYMAFISHITNKYKEKNRIK